MRRRYEFSLLFVMENGGALLNGILDVTNFQIIGLTPLHRIMVSIGWAPFVLSIDLFFILLIN